MPRRGKAVLLQASSGGGVAAVSGWSGATTCASMPLRAFVDTLLRLCLPAFEQEW